MSPWGCRRSFALTRPSVDSARRPYLLWMTAFSLLCTLRGYKKGLADRKAA